MKRFLNEATWRVKWMLVACLFILPIQYVLMAALTKHATAVLAVAGTFIGTLIAQIGIAAYETIGKANR